MSQPVGVSLSPRLSAAREHTNSTCHVALIRPPIVIFPNSLSSYGPVPPIGLAYIAAALDRDGHRVTVVDGAGEAIHQSLDFETAAGVLRRIGLSPDEIVSRLPHDVDVIGISHMFLHEWPTVRELAAALKARFPNVPIILGGENATAFHPWIFQESEHIFACILGEGERSTSELIQRIANGESLAGCPGIAFRQDDGDILNSGLPVRMRDLGEVERPAWELFPLENYWRYSDFFGIHRGRSIPVLGTRGCPYKCTFCSSPQMWTTRYVVRDVVDLVDEIEDYVRRFNIENVNFCDLTAVTKRQWTLDLCAELKRRNLDLEFQIPVGTRIESLDDEVLFRLHEAGCRYITFAPESGSPRMLEVYDKRVTLDRIHSAIRGARRVGLHSRVNIIIGHPEERWSDVALSLKFLIRAAWNGCDDAAVIMFCAYPGSKDFEQLVTSGTHRIDEAAYYVGLSRAASGHKSYNPRMPSWSLRILQLALAAIFYGLGLVRRPQRVWQYVMAQRSGTERTFFDQLLRIKRRGFDAQPSRDPSPVTKAA